VAGVDLLLNPEVWVAFLTLLALEIVLGIDNIVFISILVDKLPEHRQALARWGSAWRFSCESSCSSL
jgi:predicted tellurium resistance membrane protein TerC